MFSQTRVDHEYIVIQIIVNIYYEENIYIFISKYINLEVLLLATCRYERNPYVNGFLNYRVQKFEPTSGVYNLHKINIPPTKAKIIIFSTQMHLYLQRYFKLESRNMLSMRVS